MSRPHRFRHSSAIVVAAVIVMIAGLSLLKWAPVLLVLLVFPLAVALWAWRSGTDADEKGLTVRAALGTRRIPWSDVSGLVTDARGRVSAQLASGRVVPLPAVWRSNLPAIVTAAGHELETVTDPT